MPITKSRGRPAHVSKEKLIATILEHRIDIVSEQDADHIISEHHAIWSQIEEELLHKIEATTLYSYVCNNKYDLKTLLLGKTPEEIYDFLNGEEDVSSDVETKETRDCTFNFLMSKEELDTLVTGRFKTYKDKNDDDHERWINILQPKKWTDIFSRKIAKESGLLHGYGFKNHHILI